MILFWTPPGWPLLHYTYSLSFSFYAPVLPVQLMNLYSQETNWRDWVSKDFQFLKKVINFFVSWFSNCWPCKHLLYNFLAWFPPRFLTVLIHVLVHIALSFHKFLLFPPYPSFLPPLSGPKFKSHDVNANLHKVC